ncbi:hypothetical protein BGZ75_006695, partial [Mortierella antarctica]
PEFFRGRLDIRALLNYEDEEMDFLEDAEMTSRELLFADVEDALPASEDDSVEEPIIPRTVAQDCLLTVKKYIEQQEEVNLRPELSSTKTLLDFMESKRVLNLEQTTIHQYFKSTILE